jgi:hypothetical protein
MSLSAICSFIEASLDDVHSRMLDSDLSASARPARNLASDTVQHANRLLPVTL